MVFLSKKNTSWLSCAKWSALKTCIQQHYMNCTDYTRVWSKYSYSKREEGVNISAKKYLTKSGLCEMQLIIFIKVAKTTDKIPSRSGLLVLLQRMRVDQSHQTHIRFSLLQLVSSLSTICLFPTYMWSCGLWSGVRERCVIKYAECRLSKRVTSFIKLWGIITFAGI